MRARLDKDVIRDMRPAFEFLRRYDEGKEGRKDTISVSLAPDVAQRLRARKEGASAFVERAVRAAFQRERRRT